MAALVDAGLLAGLGVIGARRVLRKLFEGSGEPFFGSVLQFDEGCALSAHVVEAGCSVAIAWPSSSET